MSDWMESNLQDLAVITSGGTPSRNNPEFWGGEIPWVTPTDITSCKANYLHETEETISSKGLAASSAKMLPEGSLLFTSRATIGAMKIAGKPVATNQGFKSLTPKQRTDGLFLFYQIQKLRNEFIRFGAGSTFLEINKKDVGRIKIPHPKKIKEQQKIATILSTTDTAIEKTEALIEKYQQIKAGLMHDLFTRGVLPNGQLRPSREEAPELYYETEIGWIPRGWKISELGNMGTIFNGTTPSRQIPSYWNGEIPWLSSGKINEYIIDSPSERVSEIALSNTPLRVVPAGSVLVGLIGQGRTRGMSARTSIDTTINQNIAAIVVNDFNHGVYVHQYLHHNYRRLRSGGRGSNQSALNCELLRVFLIAKPELSEQKSISHILQKHENKQFNERKFLLKLQAKKLGLMQDLLTGKVPVTVDDPEAVNE